MARWNFRIFREVFAVLLEIFHTSGMLTPLSRRMPMPEPSPHAKIPESLRLQLEDFRRVLWRAKILEAIAAGTMGLLVSFLLVYGLDRLVATPMLLRLAILLGGVSLFAGFAPYWLHRWVWGQRQETQLARLIARRYPGMGDRLLGVLELQNQEEHADTLSPRLREAAMAAVAAEAAKNPLVGALPPTRHRRGLIATVGLAIVCAAAFALTPKASWNALQRWILPLSSTERYTFTRLLDPPASLAVPFGEAFEVRLQLSPDSETRPNSATGTYGTQAPVTTSLRKNAYSLLFPGQQAPGTIHLRVGDLRHEIRVTPTPRPSVQAVRAVISPPAYLGLPAHTQDLNGGVLHAVEGSFYRIELEMNRALASGFFGPPVVENPPESPTPDSPTPPTENFTGDLIGNLILSGNRASTPEFRANSVPFGLPFSWRDTLGLDGDADFRLRIEATKDAPPSCYLQGLDRQKVLLPEETLDFEVLAEDDFGVTATGIEWSGEFTRPTDQQPAKGELTLDPGGPGSSRLLKPAAFSPAAFGISPQKISLRAFTGDALPGRPRVFSEPVILYVLSRDEHAQMLKSLFDRQISELEDLSRRETTLLEENQRLERLDGTELQKDENRKRLETQQQEEAETQRRMEELTRRMEQLMKDATRNGDIDKPTLKKMAESLKSMQELSENDIPKVRQPLNEADDASNTPEKSAKDVDDAVAQQEKVVEKMRDAIDKANEANRRFEAGTFVNRLKKAASEEHGIVQSLKEGFSRILGLGPRAVDPSDLRRLEENARQQADTSSDLRWLQEDLGHYHARTQDKPLKAILDAMKASNIDLALEETRGKLSSNHSFEAAEEAKKWADQLNAWAKTLEGENEKNGGGGEGGESPDAENEDFEFMLRVMKIVQKEQDLRSRTRVLEQLRRSAAPAAEKPQATPQPTLPEPDAPEPP